jgi:NAD(P)-dependent dehydrogenase (short-subunit alcohol dehydrogenase family)
MTNDESRVVVVTGGAGGLGRAISEYLGRAGYRLIVTYRTATPEGDDAGAALRNLGVDAIARQVDLEDLAAVETFGDDIAAQYPTIHGLVNCAGRLHRGDLAATASTELLASFTVNCAAPIVLVRSLVSSLRSGHGSVVNVASITAEAAGRDRIAYTASKAALVGVTRALALELAPEIRVNAILPGLFDTSMNTLLKDDPMRFRDTVDRIPGRRLGRPEELASVVAFLLGSGASYLTGVALPVDGGVLARTPLPAGDPPRAEALPGPS